MAAASPPPPPSAPQATSSSLRLSLGPLACVEQRLRVGQGAGHGLVLVAPEDVDAVMDMYIGRSLMDADPYWQVGIAID